MKSKAFCGLLTVFVLALCSGLAVAQEAKSQMVMVFDCPAKPSTDAKLYEALKEMTAFYAKHTFPFSWSAIATEDFHYYYIFPIAGFADIEKFFKTDEETMTKAAAEYQALMEKFKDTNESYEFQVYTYRPDLSSVPAKPYYKPEEMKFVFYDFCSIVAGKEQEAEKLFKEMMAIAQKKGVRDTIYCYSGTFGVEQPVYVFIDEDKDEAEFIKHNTEMWKLMGKDVSEIYNKFMALCWKREYKRGWYQPELSYSPKK